ncbi:MAG: rod shape-determining protein RodA [Acidobacteriota bacterium]|nr:MAG: rod shape-determining protein RodA [Acidobacteriota bacterium]
MIVDRRLLPHLDWTLLAAVLALTLLGLSTIYSVTWDIRADQPGAVFWNQVYALPVAFVALLVCLVIDYRTLAQRSLLIYGGLILLLIAVMFFGVVRGGSRRWIPIGGFSLQPSEFARMVIALVLAAYFADGRRSARSLGELAGAIAIVSVPFLLIARQPDLGTAVTLLPVLLGVTYLAGLRLKWIGIAAVVFVLASPVIWAYGLQDYQKERIATFIDPEKDPRGAGYQQIQAKITVGSGGFYGKGFRQGTQGVYQFLPVAHNDFVFSVFAEEHGFLGVLVALGLYLFVLARSLDAARLARDRLGAFLVVGIVSGFGFQVLYNITMSAGLAPVKGLTLPLMSYGGSSLVSTFAGFGLILNVRMRRFTN